MHNLYEILEVNENASTHAIKAAYRRKVLSEHPDKGGDVSKMILLTEAYTILSNPTERKRFDEEWGIFNESYDVFIKPLGSLPSAGIAFSKYFRQKHAQFVEKCKRSPLGPNVVSFIFKHSGFGLYSDKDKDKGNDTEKGPDDVFSFIKFKKKSPKKPEEEPSPEEKEEVSLTPKLAVKHFLKFLKGDYAKGELRNLCRVFYAKLKQSEAIGQQNSHEFQLYYGIYKIFLIVVKDKTPTADILFSLHKITEFAKHNTADSIYFTAPLFQSKYFRGLFFQALNYYCILEGGTSDESYTEEFNELARLERSIEDLKSKLSKNRTTRKSNDPVVNSLRRARLLLKLEKKLRENPVLKAEENETSFDQVMGLLLPASNGDRIERKGKSDLKTITANLYREKAFDLLDWLPAILSCAGRKIAVNTLLQIVLTIQKAATEEPDITIRMADEKLLALICTSAVSIAHRITPDIELYACLHSVKCLVSCTFSDSEFEEILKALQSRVVWLADLFPFFLKPQSNLDFIEEKNDILDLMRQFLHSLVDRTDDEAIDQAIVIDHSYARVLYQAHEACLRNWYLDNHDPELEKKIRLRLMQELLNEKQWTSENINYNLNAPWPLANLYEGWTCRTSSILPSAREANTLTYKTVHGFEINYSTGQIAIILDYCEESDEDYNRLLTFADLCELICYGLTSAMFSLDPVDGDMPYHPFNKMFFKPSTLFHSQLLHTMFITDYLLKFFTVGQEVQRCEPYDLRSLDYITSELPDHLKKVIQDFHASHGGESISRFWIESEEVNLTIESLDDETVLHAFDKNCMVVKHRKMERDLEGNLVDTADENEGWDCYVLTKNQLQELYTGERYIANSALIIVKDSWELIIYEYQKPIHLFTLEGKKHDLISLSERERDSQEKVKTNHSESVRQIYRIMLDVAEKTGEPHRYSPEFIFAQEFTKYYDEFAIYFPEFGRLRELSKAVALVNVMANQREANQKQIQLIRKRLNYATLTIPIRDKKTKYPEEYQYWLEIEQKIKESVRNALREQFEEWRTKCSKEKLERKRQEMLQKIRQDMGTLNFTEFSPEIKAACDAVYNSIRSDIISEYGYSGWNSVSHQIYNEAVKPQIPQFIKSLATAKKNTFRNQLSEIFQDEFALMITSDVSRLLDGFFNGYDAPLRDVLVRYDRKQVAKEIQQIFPEHTIDSLDEALNNLSASTMNDMVESETKKQLQKQHKRLEEILNERLQVENSFTDLGFKADTDEIDLEGTCSWVPASFQHNAEVYGERSVYGGVFISGWVKQVKAYANPKDVAALSRQTTKRGITAAQNKVWGNAVANWYRENVVKKEYCSSKYNIQDTYHISASGKRRYWDTVVKEKSSGKIVNVIENKTGNSRNRRQEKFDLWAFKNGILDNPVKLVKLAPEIRPRTWSF